MTLAHDAAFWRRLARFGAARGPEWWVRWSPPVFGLAGALAVPSARRQVRANLHRLRGDAGPVRDAVDVARTFATYAGCLAEVLSNGSKNARMPEARITGLPNLDAAMAGTKGGIIIVTAHTAGWETVGPLLSRDIRRDVVMVMAPEADERARELQDAAREASGLRVVHVGDPMSSIKLLKELRRGSVVALQIDRAPPNVRTRPVSLLGAPAGFPEGPLRLAAASGAAILPLFSARESYRRYLIDVRPPLFLSRRPTDAELDAASTTIAGELQRFLRAHPTQWFHFSETPAVGPPEASGNGA